LISEIPRSNAAPNPSLQIVELGTREHIDVPRLEVAT
jgi:hypothetical protein